MGSTRSHLAAYTNSDISLRFRCDRTLGSHRASISTIPPEAKVSRPQWTEQLLRRQLHLYYHVFLPDVVSNGRVDERLNSRYVFT